MQNQQTNEAPSISLLTYHKGQGFQLQQQAVRFLSTVPSNKHLHVVSIIGKVKSGKSYLLNKLIRLYRNQSQPVQQYFPMSNYIGDCTKGINILTSWIQTSESVILFLDLEGIGSLNNNSSYDSKLFALVLMLSSTIIYNNTGPIDEQALQNLSFLIQIGKLFQKSILQSNSATLGLPSLFMVLRDFSLKLQNDVGLMITPKQYMEDSLEEQKGVSETIAYKNRVRRVIRSLFPERNCQTLVLPSQKLPMNYDSDVRSEFQYDLKRLSAKLLSQISDNPKCANNRKLNSDQYSLYLKQIMSNFNQADNCIPRMENILVQVYRKQANQLSIQFLKNMQQFSLTFDEYLMVVNQKIQFIREDSQQFVDHEDIQDIQDFIAELNRINNQIQNNYEGTCFKIQELIKKQGNIQLNNQVINYNNPAITSIKEFKDIYQLKQRKQGEICKKIQQLNLIMSKTKKQLKNKEMSQKSFQKFKFICEDLCLTQNLKQLQAKYTNFINNLSKKQTNVNSIIFENNLLKLEVAYLRRKLQLKQRAETTICILCKKTISQQIQIQEQTQVLQNIANKSNAFKQNNNFRSACKNSKKPQNVYSNTAEKLISQPSKQLTMLNDSHLQSQLITNKFSSIQFSKTIGNTFPSKSFYVPYLIIQNIECMNVEIIRTLIKQDSSRRNYIQYVLEVVLINKRWVFNRKWKDFCELNNILHNLFPKNQLPVFEPSIIYASSIEDSIFFQKQEVEVRRHKLEQYLRQLLSIESIRNSRIMQKFLKINKQYITTL